MTTVTPAMRPAVPLWDEQLEADVIAACLVDQDAVTRVAATGITPSDFFTARARYAYEAIRAVSAADGAAAVNTHSVAYELRQRPADDGQVSMLHVVTLAWLSRIVEELPTSIGAEWYAGRVREMAQRRRAVSAGHALVEGRATVEQAAALVSEPARQTASRRAVVPAHIASAAQARPTATVPDFACSVRGCGREAVTYGPDEQPYCERCAPVTPL